MIKLKNKFAIGCLAQWYEIEIFEEYIESVIKSLSEVENKKNVIVDVVVNLSQSLEQIDREQKELGEIYMIQEKIQDYKQHKTISDSKLKGLFDVTILSDIDKINMKNGELT